MKTWKAWWLLSLVLVVGCSLNSDEKVSREQALKSSTDGFVNAAVQGDWAGLYSMSDGTVNGADKLKDSLSSTWPSDSTLTGGDITFMSWVNDSRAKVKVNWAFQSGSVQSYSSETFVWAWKGSGWKYAGRALR